MILNFPLYYIEIKGNCNFPFYRGNNYSHFR